MKTIKKHTLAAMVTIIGIIALSLTACDKFKYQESTYHQQFSYVGIIDGKTVFFDNDNDKVLYVGNNRIVSSIDLNSNTNEISTTKSFKHDFTLATEKDDGITFGPGKIIFNLSTRYYNNQMLYQLSIEVKSLGIERHKTEKEEIMKNIREKKLKLFFLDKDKFELKSFTPQNISGHIDYANLESQGRIPITLENYMEIKDIKIEGITILRKSNSEE